MVDQAGNPISGVFVLTFVYRVTAMSSKVVAVTGDDGAYDVPCSNFPLLITPLTMGWHSTPIVTNLAYRYVGGTSSYVDAPPAPCEADGEPPVVTTLEPGGTITGHVASADGTPIEQGNFWLMDLQLSPPSVWAFAFTFTGSEYSITGLPTGDYIIGLPFGGPFPSVRTQVHIEAGTTIVQDLVMPTPDPPTTESTSTTTTTTP